MSEREVEMLTRPELIAALEMAEARVAELEAENNALKVRRESYYYLENKVVELEASALSGYEDGWHKLRMERDALKARVAEIEAENHALRWAIWQHCEVAESKIAEACQRHKIPYTESDRSNWR
jgi:hypothetical protein